MLEGSELIKKYLDIKFEKMPKKDIIDMWRISPGLTDIVEAHLGKNWDKSKKSDLINLIRVYAQFFERAKQNHGKAVYLDEDKSHWE
jgi:hypothetical protein